jgi:hypothetical protein
MAFTPQNVPTDQSLNNKLLKIPSAPDIWIHPSYDKVPKECIIDDGQLLARGYMTLGPFSLIEIEIIAFSGPPSPVGARMKPLQDGETISSTLTSRNHGVHGFNLGKDACIIEIGNCLNGTLRNGSAFFCNSARNNFLPSEIRPFYRERFFASHNTTVEAMFSYEIESTDLFLVVALRVQSGNNSFAVAFDQVPGQVNRNEWLALMDPMTWKTHSYRKYAHAKDGEQVIQIQNIRASVKMTEDAESLFNIRVFAV